MWCKYIIHIWNKCVIPECVLFFFINDINWLQSLIKNEKPFHLVTLVTSSGYNFAAIVDMPLYMVSLTRYMTCTLTVRTMSTHARPIAGAFSSLPWTFRLLTLLIFINFIKIMLPVDYGYLHNSIYIVNWASISVFRAGFGRYRSVSWKRPTRQKRQHA